jgi:hypothetical protein
MCTARARFHPVKIRAHIVPRQVQHLAPELPIFLGLRRSPSELAVGIACGRDPPHRRFESRVIEVEVNPKLCAQVGMSIRDHVDPFDRRDLLDILRPSYLASWFQATNVFAIVRIHKSFAHLIPGILDQGITGIQVSEVDTAEEARAIVRLAKYPPIGNRGISGQGPHTGYKSYGARHATEYAPWANENMQRRAVGRIPSVAVRWCACCCGLDAPYASMSAKSWPSMPGARFCV